MVNPYEAPTLRAESPSRTESASGKRWSIPVVIAVGILVPGLPSLLMRRNWGGMFWFAFFIGMIPFAYGFCGPLWDVVLFDGTPYDQAGIYPFIATCVLVPLGSIWRGLKDRSLLVG